MTRAIEAAKKISSALEKNSHEILYEINLHLIFAPVEELALSTKNKNSIIVYIILAYDNDSPWLDLRKDRFENKLSILKSLNCDSEDPRFKELLSNHNDTINNIILDYTVELTDWRWNTIFSLLDYHSNMLRFVNQKTESEKSIDKMDKDGGIKTLVQDYDIDTLAGVNEKKGKLLDLALSAREKADKLILEIKKEFVNTDNAVQQDLGFSITETYKKKDIYSWSEFIRTELIPKRKKMINSADRTY